MPEGDSIYQLSRRLQFLVGRTVLAADIRVPRHATVNLAGTTIRRVWPYGKHLFMQLDDAIIHTHLKMEGTWAIHRVGDRWRKPAHTARLILRVADPPHQPIELVGHSLGFVKIFSAKTYPEHIGHLGPDVLALDWEHMGEPEAWRRIMLRPDRPVGTALLDQTNLAGIGNEYRAEICFIAGIHPQTPVKLCDMHQVLAIARRLIWGNRLSPLRVTTGVRRVGESTYVFGRDGQPCRRCGTVIATGTLGGAAGGDEGELERMIWWCPRCQPPVI